MFYTECEETGRGDYVAVRSHCKFLRSWKIVCGIQQSKKNAQDSVRKIRQGQKIFSWFKALE